MKHYIFGSIINIKDRILLCLGPFSQLQRILLKILFLLSSIIFFFFISLEQIKPFNYVNIALFFVFCFLLIIYIFLFGRFYFDKFFVLLLFFAVFQIISLIVNSFVYFNQTGLLMVAFALFYYEYFKQLSIIQIKKQLFVFGICCFLFLLIFFFKYYNDIVRPNFSNRIGTYFGNQNDVARHLSYSSSIYISLLFFCKRKLLSFIFALLCLVSIYFVLLTGSVSNILVIFISVFIYLFLFFSGKRRIIFFLISICLISCFIVLLNMPFMSYFKNRIVNILNSFFSGGYGIPLSKVDSSAIERANAAYYGFKLFLNSPIFGNCYSSVYRNYSIMSHNNIVEVASDFGFFALLIEEVVLLLPIIYNRKSKKIFMLFSLFALLFQLFLTSYNSKIDSCMLSLCYACLPSAYLKINLSNKESKELSIVI